ncbi:MAG: histidine phosphatase family protein [Pseudomonadota bacterium]
MIFVRHPSTSAPAGLCYGRLEVGLSRDADREISGCLESLPAGAPVVASPMRRCRPLAERVAAREGAAPQYEPRLVEYHFGAWEGQLWSDIPRDVSQRWTDDVLTEAPPGGERFIALIDRVRAALAELPENAIVVSHAGPIRAARMILTGADFDTVFADPVPYATPLSFAREAA